MSLDLSLVGRSFGPHVLDYGWRDVVQYALGIGATSAELDFLYERAPDGLKVFPTFAVVPAYPAVAELLGRVVSDPTRLVHGAQLLELHRPIPAAAVVHSTATLRGIYDLKRLAELDILVRTTLGDELLSETEWTLYVLGAGGRGLRRSARPVRAAKLPRDRAPDWSFEQQTSPEQALLYRLSGDTNPLHVDPQLARAAGFERGPILQGLCTLGFVARAVLRNAASVGSRTLRSLHAQFRRPVWPGDTLRVEGYGVTEDRVAVRVTTTTATEPVLSDCWAELAEP